MNLFFLFNDIIKKGSDVMKIKSILYVLLCLLGGCMIGLNAGKLNNVANIIMFTFGVAILVYGVAKSNK